MTVDEKFNSVSSESSDMIGHMATIKRYSSECKSAVEFGVYDCTSTWALMAGHPEKLTSYDVARRPEVDEVEQVSPGSGTVFKFVLANTVEVEIEETDLLFIDSDHHYAHLKRELELHAGKVRKYILLHDTEIFAHMDQDYKGVGLWPAIEEFLAAHPEWRIKEKFTHCHGLTVLERTHV